MTDQNDPASGGGAPPHRRRASIVELFTPKSSTNSSASAASSSPPAAAVPASPAPIPRRGMSMATFGLGGTGNAATSPYNAFAKQRRASISTSSASSSPEFRNSFEDGAAIVEEDDFSRATINAPSSPSFARRVSFGANALRDVKSGVGPGGGRRPSTSLSTLNEHAVADDPSASRSPGMAKATGEGFNWSDALRDKTKRSPSFSAGNPFTTNQTRTRSTSMAAMEPPKEMPKPTGAISIPASIKKPDHLGERMLRGDFMMD